MSIRFQVLGEPYRDNAVYAAVEPGQAIHRLLFDCGQHCLESLANHDVMAVDHLFFSHFHMDHLAGFDAFLRLNYARESKPVHLWGPAGATEILAHRLRGFTWDRVDGIPGEWFVSEIQQESVTTTLFRTKEAFRTGHPVESRPFSGEILRTDNYAVEVAILEHHVPSLAYRVTEPPTWHVDVRALQSMGWSPGDWLHRLKDFSETDQVELNLAGETYRLGVLRKRLLSEEPGESIAYLTDFVYSPENVQSLLPLLQGCDRMICESTYLSQHEPLAIRNYHLTARQAASLAREAGVGELILVHLSDRYLADGPARHLKEARSVFRNTALPAEWGDLTGS